MEASLLLSIIALIQWNDRSSQGLERLCCFVNTHHEPPCTSHSFPQNIVSRLFFVLDKDCVKKGS